LPSNKRILHAALRKAKGELIISLLLMGIIASTLSSFIVLASASSSLQYGLQNYVNQFAPWIVITPEGPCQLPHCAKTLPFSVIDNISSLAGVQNVYPMVLFVVWEVHHNQSIIFNGQPKILSLNVGFRSAVVGGPGSFPSTLLDITEGSFPQGIQKGFVHVAGYPPPLSNYSKFISALLDDTPLSGMFNATSTGVIAMNPLFSEFYLLWNSSFIRYELGNATYNRLFGGEPNYVIIKVDSINDVANVVNQVDDIINPYPRFIVLYNQALIDSLLSFQSQTAPLYYALDIIALIAAIAVTALLANVSSGRRIWEGGLFIAQGWLWNNVYRLYYFYFLIISISGFALSLIASIIISHLLVFRYIVYGTTLPIQLVISPVFVSIAFILAIAIPFLASFIALRKFRRNIDRMLAEY